MMPSRYRNKLMSEIPGQSGHALLDLQRSVCTNFGSSPWSGYRVVGRYAATFFFVTTVMTQRAGKLDASSFTERISPVTNEPSIVNVALSFRYWAYRQRRARV
jgi:hypothetical protein